MPDDTHVREPGGLLDPDAGVRAFLADPATMRVLWMNEPAARMIAARGVEPLVGAPVEAVVPIATGATVADVVGEVAATGVDGHLRADLVSTARGTMSVLTSLHRMPDGDVLILAEQVWRSGRRAGKP